jgi:hypothetical protein
VRSLTELYDLQIKVETYNAPKGHLQCKHCQHFGHTQRNCGYAPRCVACEDANPSWNCVTLKQQLKCCICGGKHTAKYRGCSKWVKAKTAAAKPTQVEHLPAPKAAPITLPPEQEKLGPGEKHILREAARIQCPGFCYTNPHLKRQGERTEYKAACTASENKDAILEKIVAQPHPIPADSAAPNVQIPSPLEGIADLLDNFPTKACES